MKKFRLLSVALLVLIVALAVFVACNGKTVEEHDHVWNGGTVTTEPTCHSEGLRTYACTVEGCTQTKTEPIAMTQHNWDDGTITTPSTCQAMGVKTYACQNEGCNATKTENLSKSSHDWDEGVLTEIPNFYTPGSKKYTCLTDGCGTTRTESVEAHADFAEQYYFSLADSNKNNWSYGYVADFDAASTSYTFAQITQIDAQSNAWKATGVEISKGHISQNNANAAVMYTFKEVVKKGMQANVAISFVGDESATVVRAYLFVTHAGNTTKIELNQNGAKDWKYTPEEAYDLAQGDVFAVVFENAGTGKAGGTFTFTLTAPCNHVWGEATELEAAKCEDPGTMQYTCLNCGATKEEETDPIGHNWDEGTITKNPTETEKGERTFNCLNGCGQTKTEEIPMLLPSNFERADFMADFNSLYNGENIAWQVGIVDFTDDDKFSFTPLEARDDAFRNSDPWIEIRGDWAAINGMAGIAYTFGVDVKVDLNFSITRKNADNADFAIRWAVKNSSGAIVSNDGNANWAGKTSDEGKNGTVTINETIDFHAGETIYILINHEGGGDQCEYTYTLTKHSDEPQTAFAEFKKDFHDDATTNNWEYGSADYAWNEDKDISFGGESFNYTQGTYNSDAQAWQSGDASIKAGSVDIRNNATIVYTFGKDMTVNIYLTFKGEEGKTVHAALRIFVVNSEGVAVQRLDTFGVGSTGKNEWTATFNNVQVGANYKIYIIFFEEGGNDSSIAEFDCKFTSDQAQGGEEPDVPPTEGTTVTFADEFDETLAGEDNGWSVGNIDYTFGQTESFEYFKTDKKNGGNDGFNNVDDKPFFEIKSDWAAIGEWAAIAYAFKGTGDAHFNFEITGIGNATFSVRYAIVGANGDAKPEFAGNDAHVAKEADITVEAGDVLYIIIHHEQGDGDNQCNFSYTVTKHFDESDVPPTEDTTVNFNDDFGATLAGENNGWAVGNVDYKFDPERFEYFKTDRKNDGNDAFVNVDGKPFFEIKSDWAAIADYAAIAYTFKEAGKVHFRFDITGVAAATFTVRYAVIGENGEVKTAPVFVGNNAHVTAEYDISVEAGDVLYVIITHEQGGDDNQCNFSFELNAEA